MNTIDILLGFGAGHLLVSALLFAIAVVVARLRPLVPADARLWLRVIKLAPPVEGLAGGVSFSLGEFAGPPT